MAATAVSAMAILALIAVFCRGLGTQRVLTGTAALLATFLVPWLIHLAVSPPIRPDMVPVDAAVSPSARIVGRELADKGYAPGDTIQATVIWQAVAYSAADRQSGLRLISPDGPLTVAEHWSRPNLDRTPTGKWVQGELIPDALTVRIPARDGAGPLSTTGRPARRSDNGPGAARRDRRAVTHTPGLAPL